MGPFLDTHVAPQQIALDIEVELEYWHRCYNRTPLYRQGLAYETYVPAIKFAYDCYLHHHRDDLKMLFPALKERYERQFPLPQRTEWQVVERIVKAVWQRIRSGRPCVASRKGAAFDPSLRGLQVRKARNVVHA